MTETTITLNIIIDDVVDRFVVKWQRDGAAPEELDLKGMKRSVVILSLQPNTLYTITVTAHLPGGQERTSEVKEWTKSKWYWYLAQSFGLKCNNCARY